MDDELNARSLEYHRLPRPGQLTLATTKPLTSQRDLALACSPGVAAAASRSLKSQHQYTT
ncbi:MAG: hypothetical protein QF598_06205 [Arenicellales bacterium]|jgi:malate dehydrogenase (oxaloacetate-decarboxylating)(NADP+)|nr:hypothetical protein [Arenicellales bacterium]